MVKLDICEDNADSQTDVISNQNDQKPPNALIKATMPAMVKLFVPFVIKVVTPLKNVLPTRLAASERAAVREIVENLLDNEKIRESASPYASPVLLDRKKDGIFRMNYCELNSHTVKDRYPLPLITISSTDWERENSSRHLTWRRGFIKFR